MKSYRAMRLNITLLTCLCAYLLAGAVDTATRIFDPAFRTLKVQREGDFMAPPVIRLGSDERLTVSFDELTDDVSYLRWRLVHCNADWQPSMLLEQEYVEGFNVADVEDYAFSSNTFMHYVNYRITVPSEGMRPLVSGNYLLQVYPEQDDDRVLLQARFSVSEEAVRVIPKVTTSTDMGINGEWQQVTFDITTDKFKITDPFSELYITVVQNGSADHTATTRRPLRVEPGRLIYDHDRALIFPAGNEYRRFETVRVDYPGMHVDSVRYIDPAYHAYLAADRRRDRSEYLYDQTQFGRYMVREYNATDSDLGADYVTVHFTLESPELPGTDIYVDGELTHGLRQPQYRMHYDIERRAYTLQLPLKQGSYNYRYVTVPRRDPGARADHALTEGNHYETNNEYTISVFMHRPGDRADRLIGTATVYAK